MQTEIRSNNELPNKKEEIDDRYRKKNITRLVMRCILYLVLVFVCIFIIPRYVIHRAVVEGPSMEPTLYEDEHILVEKISTYTNRLKRYDVIVFYPYEKTSDEYFIKRVIGLPGETIWISDGIIYIDNVPLDESFGMSTITYEGIAKIPVLIGEDEYFVLGDNRSISFDSRYEQIGLVKNENIIGRAIMVLWPLKNFGTIE